MKIPGFTLRGFKRPHEAVAADLGALEREVMQVMWRDHEASVREVHRSLGEHKAYTTVMTTLDRLYKKGLLARRKSGRAFLYSARLTREEFERGVAEDVFAGLLGRAAGEAEPLLACLVEAVGERDRELLDELDRLVRQKKQELRKETT
ncbi:MAG TPA: BlaI/MecI/CopY family transcriptional regulator [Pyrinomonadaceae bacterium]|nr:BlaI/MecI/CopY family transcriptional regulator [Pyrinomonadaceae bacterium]